MIKKIIQKILNPPRFILTTEHKECLELLENSKENLIITGKAGTGKSTLIQYFRNNTKKKVIVLAPTGIAALNCRGQTIHSFFGFPPRMVNLKAIYKRNSRLFSDIDMIIIDEISMVRADLLDGVDKFLRLNGKDKNLPFGGIQMVFVGDLYQLPPVVTFAESSLFSIYYESPYFFSANSFNRDIFTVVELKTIFRQKEEEFVNFLNTVRNGEADLSSLEYVNKRLSDKEVRDSHITLCTTNKAAEGINLVKLEKINKPVFKYTASVEGDFPTEDRTLPVDLELKLKVGAKVLFVKNDKGGQWVNGTLGKVHKLTEKEIKVKIDESGVIVDVFPEYWDNIKYSYDDKEGEIVEKIVGKLKQFPIRLAWAITIHKSQGMTFDNVCLDFRRSPFAHGQTYVALSRCRSLEGIILTKKIFPNDIIIDERILEFHKRYS